MEKTPFVEKLSFVQARRQQDESALLALAVREGIQVLYREALIEGYLLGQVAREKVLREIGPEELEAVEYQRDALQRDVNWGISGA
ncbi:MAG: hypothetical protein ACE5F6_04825 [Anaerolineae bacterium]